MSIILTFIAAANARPPLKEEQTSNIYTEKKIKEDHQYPRSMQELLTKINQKKIKECESVVFNYLKENQGSAFTVYSLRMSLENYIKNYEERRYIRENLQMVLNNLKSSGEIDSTLHNGELHYFIADVYQKEAEQLRPIPSILEEREEVPKVAPPDELQQISPISELSPQEASEKATMEVSQLKTEEIQTVSSIPEKKEEKPVKNCPHCGQELSLEAKFCVQCGEKVEKLKPIPVITEERIEKPVIAEELEPIPSIPEKKEEPPKEISYTCKFCGMKLTKETSICPQCGTIMKM